MTCEETTVGQTIDRPLSEHPDLDNSVDGTLDNLDQFYAVGATRSTSQAAAYLPAHLRAAGR